MPTGLRWWTGHIKTPTICNNSRAPAATLSMDVDDRYTFASCCLLQLAAIVHKVKHRQIIREQWIRDLRYIIDRLSYRKWRSRVSILINRAPIGLTIREVIVMGIDVGVER